MLMLRGVRALVAHVAAPRTTTLYSTQLLQVRWARCFATTVVHHTKESGAPVQATKPQDTVFAKIVAGDIPCSKVYEDEHALAFHDLQPVAPVHVLVIPKVCMGSS
jgi:hypothetical protein